MIKIEQISMACMANEKDATFFKSCKLNINSDMYQFHNFLAVKRNLCNKYKAQLYHNDDFVI